MSIRMRSAAIVVAAAAAIIAAGAATVLPADAQQPIDPCVNLSDQVVEQEQSLCELTVTKELVSSNPAKVGGAVTFEIVVTNTGAFPLSNVDLSDVYDPTLDFTTASPAPNDVDEASGVLFWDGLLPDPDGDTNGVWDSGESRTVSVSFQAVKTPSAENCAIAVADVSFDVEVESAALQEGPGVESDLVCADVRINRETKRPRDPRPTATPRLANTPAPVSTVAGATVVPPAPTSTRPAGVIVAPDTGTGDGSAGSGGGAGTAMLALAVSVAVAAAGAALIRRGAR